MIASPVSIWASTAARSASRARSPARHRSSPAVLTAGLGSIPSSRRKSSSHEAICCAAPSRSPAVAKTPYEQRVSVLVEAVELDELSGPSSGCGCIAVREERERGLMEHRSRGSCDVAPLALEPELEARARRERRGPRAGRGRVPGSSTASLQDPPCSTSTSTTVPGMRARWAAARLRRSKLGPTSRRRSDKCPAQGAREGSSPPPETADRRCARAKSEDACRPDRPSRPHVLLPAWRG